MSTRKERKIGKKKIIQSMKYYVYEVKEINVSIDMKKCSYLITSLKEKYTK